MFLKSNFLSVIFNLLVVKVKGISKIPNEIKIPHFGFRNPPLTSSID